MLAGLSAGEATSLLQAQERSLRAFLILCFPRHLSRAETPHQSPQLQKVLVAQK